MFDARIDSLERLPPPQEIRALAVRTEVPRPPARWEQVVHLTANAAVHAHNLRGLGFAAVLAVVLWMLGAPLLVPWVLLAGAAHYTGSVAISTVRGARAQRARGPLALPLAPEVEPTEIASVDLRATYEGILRLHEDIRRSLVAAERMQAGLRAVFERCGAVVQVAGRLARLTNPLQGYLEMHGAAHVEHELHRLAVTADVAADPLAQGVYQSAAAARGRQLGTLFEIQNLRDRIRARLELISASLESVSALIIKLQVLDLEQVELAGESMSEQLASLGDELAVLESTIEDDF